MLTEYIDRERTTIAILRDYRDAEWKKSTGKEKLHQIDERLYKVGGSFGSDPVQGGAPKIQEHWCAAIDEKTVLEKGARMAEEYFDELSPCLARLTDEERDMIYLRWIDCDERDGIQTIMDSYHIAKTEAYKRSNAALSRLAKLIFW